MKTRYSGLDLSCQMQELKALIGMRVNKIYDIDKKTYLFRMQRTEEKAVIMLESGSRIHTTNSVWPKSDAPSGFTMKLRKHLRNKRLEDIYQFKTDRIAVLQFGINEVANYVIVELYDRGNIILTDHEHVILAVLRPRLNDENNKVIVRETYPVSNEKQDTQEESITIEKLNEIVEKANPTDNMKKMFVPHCSAGPALLEHLFLTRGIVISKKKRDLDMENIGSTIVEVLKEAETFLKNNQPKGYLIQKVETNSTGNEMRTNIEFHPFRFKQHEQSTIKEFETFNGAVDEFFSQLESQKLDVKVAQQERQAMKKLDNIKKDHETRLSQLEEEQSKDRECGELIEMNAELVDKALNILRNAIANQIDWKDIEDIVEEAGDNGDPVLSRIRKLKLDINHFTMLLANPYEQYDYDSDDSEGNNEEPQEHEVELDIDLTAQANARKYYDKKKLAAVKEQKTLQSHSVAIKSAERKTKQTLRDVAVSANIIKARKNYWFEKFFWFISSENYLVIGGKDQQQNELIVKRYMAPNDLYVHADLHGATSVIVKNPSGQPVPPKSLNEAGQLAVCFSAAWDSKVVTSAYWVESSQVSKSAPTGEYLTTGSFMIRGKKNYLPPSHLILGFGILFKLGEECVENHKNERRVRTLMEDEAVASTASSEQPQEIADNEVNEEEVNNQEEEEEIKSESSQSDDEDNAQSLSEEQINTKEDLKNEINEDNSDNDDTEDISKEFSDKLNLEKNVAIKEEVENITSTDAIEFPDTNLQMNFSSVTGGLEFKANLTPEVALQDQKPSFATENNKKAKNRATKSAGSTTSKANINTTEAKNKKSSAITSPNSDDDGDQEKGRPLAAADQNEGQKQQQMKRGQKGKQKKIKEKYKDQDDEEKALRMQLLHQAQKDDGKRAKKKRKEQQMKAEKENKVARMKANKQQHLQKQKGQTFQQASAIQNEVIIEDPAAEDGDDEATGESHTTTTIRVSDEVDMIDALTGIPLAEDELMFAIPVIGPYNAMTNYKYRVKVTPGTSKRGKAAKTTLMVFMADRAATSREKDLLKSLKDQDVSRNLPGKVKISAPQLLKSKVKTKAKQQSQTISSKQ